MTPGVEIRLRTLDVLDAAMAGRPDPVALGEVLRPDLEVLSREDLVRLVVDIAATASVTAGAAARPRVVERLTQLRVQAMWAAS